jgi:hypothetical protein
MHHITEIEHSALYKESFRKLKIGHCMIHKLIKKGGLHSPFLAPRYQWVSVR